MIDFFKQKDKQLHILVSLTITIVLFGLLQYISVYTNFTYKTDLVISSIISLLIGYAKELYDKAHPNIHTYDMKDLLADSIGIAIAIIIIIIYQELI